jgi:ribonuclease J
MDVTIHRGSKEIGGSCVEVSAGGTRLILDAGLPLVTPEREPFDSRTIRGKSNAELIAAKVIPDVPGLFADGDRPDAILLSHSHLDHSGLLHLTRPEIPIHATSGTSKMMLAAGVFGGQKSLEQSRHSEVEAGLPFEVGAFRVTPYAVDHSCFGSVAYLVEADGTTLLYSGDLRLHGRKPGMIRSLIAAVAPRNVDALVMEGTHVGAGRGRGKTEYDLEEVIHGLISTAPKLVLGAFSPIDVDRVVTYYKATRRAGRIFVADAYTAFVMHLVASESALPGPRAEAGVRVFFNKAFERRNLGGVADKIGDARISLDEIRANPAKYAMVFRPSMTDLDFAGRLPEGSRCIYSYWQGYLVKPDWKVLQEQLAAVGGDFIPAHASGHIYEDDLVDLVRSLNPKRVIPIHTFEPGGFLRHFPNATPLNDGERSPIG